MNAGELREVSPREPRETLKVLEGFGTRLQVQFRHKNLEGDLHSPCPDSTPRGEVNFGVNIGASTQPSMSSLSDTDPLNLKYFLGFPGNAELPS